MPDAKVSGRPRNDDKERGESPRDDIVAAATKLFTEKGYAQTTMSDIAREVGLQQSSLYYWFKRKDVILKEALVVNRAPVDFIARVGTGSGSAALKLYRLLHFDTRQLAEANIDFNEIESIAGSACDEFRTFWQDYARLHRAVAELIDGGIAEGHFIECDAATMATVVLSVNEGIQKRFRRQDTHAAASGHEFVHDALTASQWAHLSASTSIRSLLIDPGQLESIRSDAP